jgi:hypothetical protein
LALGFPFAYFGRIYTQVQISSNGFITFGDENTSSGCCSGQNLPNPRTPNNVVAGFWEDLAPNRGGTITWGTIGREPTREWVVQFSDVARFGDGEPISFQIVISEIGLIETHCMNCVAARNDQATQGIENSTGTFGLATPGRNASTWAAEDDGWQFTSGVGGGDDVGDVCDVCPLVSDPDQLDGDDDEVGDLCDNCPREANPEQEDGDNNGVGDVCEE